MNVNEIFLCSNWEENNNIESFTVALCLFVKIHSLIARKGY